MRSASAAFEILIWRGGGAEVKTNCRHAGWLHALHSWGGAAILQLKLLRHQNYPDGRSFLRLGWDGGIYVPWNGTFFASSQQMHNELQHTQVFFALTLKYV